MKLLEDWFRLHNDRKNPSVPEITYIENTDSDYELDFVGPDAFYIKIKSDLIIGGLSIFYTGSGIMVSSNSLLALSLLPVKHHRKLIPLACLNPFFILNKEATEISFGLVNPNEEAYVIEEGSRIVRACVLAPIDVALSKGKIQSAK